MASRLLCAVVALVVGVSLLLEPAARAAGAAPSRFTRLRTPHFVLIGEDGERPLRRVAERLEQFRDVFGRVFPSTKQALPAPTVVHVFTSKRDYLPFMPRFNGKPVEVGGYFQQAEGANYITLSTEFGEYAYPTIFHEYVHLLVGNALADVPIWFNEGLAEYYSTFQVLGDRSAKLGRVKDEHVYDLRERFIPLAELLSVDHASPLYNEGSRRGVFYAESWALVHYLLIGNPKRQGQLATFLEKYADGIPSAQAVRDAFGVSEADLEKELRQYVRLAAYSSMRYTFEEKVAIDKDWTIDQPSEADGQAAYADLFLASRRYTEAAARAEAALKLVPEHPRALAVLGRIRATEGQSDAGIALLDRAVKAAGEVDYLPSYYRAQLWLRSEGKHAPDVTPEAARQALALLGRVKRLQPSLADAHGLSAYAWLVADNPGAAMASAGSAFKLSPRHEYALLHARARVMQRDLEVRPALDALVARGSSEWVKREAQELIDFLARVQGIPAPPPSGVVAARERTAGGIGVGPAETTAAEAREEPVERRPARLMPVFRVTGAGEVRELGTFEGVECPRDGVVFLVRLPTRVARVSAKAFAQVEFLTYRSEAPGQVACGKRPKPERIYLTYRPTGGATGTDGAAVAIELLPDDFEP